MKVSHILLISLLIVGALFVPAVSAAEIINESLIDFTDTSQAGTLTYEQTQPIGDGIVTGFCVRDVSLFDDISYFTLEVSGTQGYWPSGVLIPTGRHETTYTYNGVTKPAVIYVYRDTDSVGNIISTKYIFMPQEWNRQGLTGKQLINTPLKLVHARGDSYGDKYSAVYSGQSSTNLWLCNKDGIACGMRARGGASTVQIGHVTAISWVNNLLVTTTDDEVPGYTVELIRTLNGISASSTIKIYQDNSLIYRNDGLSDITLWYPQTAINKINITSPIRTHSYDLKLYTPGEPGGHGETPNMRTGSITMTDNNGTTITGFEVTAVNHYTGEEYTVSTDTDVAVMTLPMDRVIDIRNPQTGVYEEAPIGYYRFYGNAPGYKMLAEDGIQVSVMPEKYGSYQLCDIRVTQESGYLTGNHQFQIRSRSDNSILQSGTISAKSATTGEWYNTTVSGGLATLILPYDTSNSQSQYAGNYYVYASSPGYEDNDYGTQIVVMPHTVSEIKSILLTPIGGIPPAGNVTLRIQAFSETGTGIPNAEIFIAGVLGEGASLWDTYTASSTGYLTVSVPGNSTYDIVASGAGYYDSARRVEVFDTDPALIEIKLYLSGAPTPTAEPTTQPTGWVTPTSTQTSPPIQEDNIIGLSVKGLAKGFGIDYDTALLMFGLMIIFGAGGMVMSSVKGGAMEFIAGSIVGTFVAFALGLIPIWIFIIIAVVFGAYVLRVFVQGGQ